MGVATAWFRKRSGSAYRVVRESLGAVTGTLAEDIAGMRVAAVVTREPAGARELPPRERSLPQVEHGHGRPQRHLLPGRRLPLVRRAAVVLGLRRWLAFNGNISIGILVAFLGYLSNFSTRPAAVAALQHIPVAVAALDKITDLLTRSPRCWISAARATSTRRPASSHSRRPLRVWPGPRCCTGSTSTFPAGTTVALVGPPARASRDRGELLARFYDPTDGRITIDGVDLRDVAQSHSAASSDRPAGGLPLRRHVAENIAFARPGVGRQEVIAAARAVGADEFIERPRGWYETQLGERGSRLSTRSTPAGRIRTRAARRTRAILILDEATSSVTSAPSGRSSARCAASARADRVHHRAPPVRRSATPT